MAQLYSVSYISKNTADGTESEQKEQVQKILDTARKNNQKLNVTGALLYSGGYFCQVLEGEVDVLEELFEIIQMDSRHNKVTVLSMVPIEQRRFAEWAMASAGSESDMRFDIEGIRASKDALIASEAGKQLLEVLDQLVKQHQSILPPP
jgi:hypothetical protein